MATEGQRETRVSKYQDSGKGLQDAPCICSTASLAACCSRSMSGNDRLALLEGLHPREKLKFVACGDAGALGGGLAVARGWARHGCVTCSARGGLACPPWRAGAPCIWP